MFVFKAGLLRNFFHAVCCLCQQIAGAHQAQLQQILVRTGAGVLLERVADEL